MLIRPRNTPNEKGNVATFAMTALAALVIGGCASSGPRPAALIRQGVRENEKNNSQAALEKFQRVVDIDPAAFEKRRFADELAMYRDLQIRYGVDRASQAEAANKTFEAWVWNVQVSLVDPARDECRTASANAQRLKAQLGRQYRDIAAQSLQAGDRRAAIVAASQSLLYGGGSESMQVLDQAALRLNPEIQPWEFDPVDESLVGGMVRTDSIERLTQESEFAPYGIPIYFGDVPRYYVSLGTVTVKGTPIPQSIPAEYAKLDSLSKLTMKAKKKFNPDALVNVHFWTKSKKAFTVGEAVSFIHFPDNPSPNHEFALSEIPPSSNDYPKPQDERVVPKPEKKKPARTGPRK